MQPPVLSLLSPLRMARWGPSPWAWPPPAELLAPPRFPPPAGPSVEAHGAAGGLAVALSVTRGTATPTAEKQSLGHTQVQFPRREAGLRLATDTSPGRWTTVWTRDPCGPLDVAAQHALHLEQGTQF